MSGPTYNKTFDKSSQPPRPSFVSGAQSFRQGNHHTGSFTTVPLYDSIGMSAENYQAASHDQQDTSSEETHMRKCEDCLKEDLQIYNCSNCGMDFCNQCWDKQAPHRLKKLGLDGLQHEKADPLVVKRLKEILSPSQDETDQQMLHDEDTDTTWFGMGRNKQNLPVLQDYGRYSAIMAESNTQEFKARFPHLVSFVGQTGAGKSTLIKMLIDQQERRDLSTTTTLPSPVAGTSANGIVPTSGDVHLYSDPESFASERPILYADCEGLEGGETPPMAVQYRSRVPNSNPYRQPRTKQHLKKRLASKGLQVKSRDIKWANDPKMLKRQFAVEELYPRLLYTFSDVIVFVLRNAK
jgi:energy-coupling factor transporter ATP-binding protein EcfA2